MKILLLLVSCCLSFVGFATPSVQTIGEQVARTPNCEIQIINNSASHVTVYGTYEDGTRMTPFNVYTYSPVAYISLYRYKACQQSMYLDIVTFNNYRVYGAYTNVNTIVPVSPRIK